MPGKHSRRLLCCQRITGRWSANFPWEESFLIETYAVWSLVYKTLNILKPKWHAAQQTAHYTTESSRHSHLSHPHRGSPTSMPDKIAPIKLEWESQPPAGTQTLHGYLLMALPLRELIKERGKAPAPQFKVTGNHMLANCSVMLGTSADVEPDTERD